VLRRGPAADHAGPDGAGTGYHLVFADPPYATSDEEVSAMLKALDDRGWLADGALVAVERGTGGTAFAWPQGYVEDRTRRYGDVTLWYGLAAGARAG
jgi:16S rRNA (guanine966-N2)-methyltransferase